MKRLTLAVTLATLSLGAVTVAAQTAAPPAKSPATLTLEELFRNPSLSSITLSRSGKYLAATAPHKGRMNLMVMDLATRKGSLLTGFDDYDVINVSWVGDERLLFSLGQANSPTGPGQFDGGGLFVVGRDGSGARRLAPTVRESRNRNQIHRSLEFFRTIPGSTDEIIASGNMTSIDSEDLYRLNLNTGRTTLLTSGRPADRTGDWIVDGKLVPRVVRAGVKDELTQIVYYRKNADSPWVELTRFSRDKGSVFVPLGLDNDERGLIVATNRGRDTMAVYRYDPETKTLGEMVASHPRYDMGADSMGGRVSGASFDPETHKLIGYRVDADRPEVTWVDESRAKLQRMLDNALPGMINSFRRTQGDQMLVTSMSDIKPTRWYLLDEKKRTLEEIGAARPWLDGKLVEQRSFVYKTRDGLEVPGYLFLPANYKQGTRLPTIVHIHGGPHARADFYGSGFGVREGQLYASRGYAVVVPNFRITPGMGSKIFEAGFGAIGRRMSEDHEDALKWAIEQGFTDPKRACISGASYGGYAALQAMVKTPDLFKCAIAGLAVTDFKYQLTTPDGDTYGNDAGVTFWKSVLGTKDLDAPIVREISPVYNAAKIKGAVFLYAGQDDIRVPIDQIRRMDRALRDAGNPPKAFVIKEKEGHGFGKVENNVDTWGQILKFLDEQIGK
ncbi:MAG: S9 family peptidase [Proteobacteria bacterium]|nr:S9 family peptidase [Pseudomonadota bacterium]